MSVESVITENLNIWTLAIKTKSASGRGSSNKLELYGIKKLRELILELAIRGKLVPQDRAEGSASELIESLITEKEQLITVKKLRKQKTIVAIPPNEEKFNTPSNWRWAKLGQIGLVASSSRVHKKDWKSEGIPFYRAREIVQLAKFKNAGKDLFISEELYGKLTESGIYPEAEDIMLTGVGTIGVPYIVRENDSFYFKDASVLIFKSTKSLYPQYLELYMKSPFWVNSIHEDSMGTTVHTLTISRANEVHICLPPILEQKRIVSKVDELMLLCDQLESQTESSIEAHKTLVETLLATLTNAKDADELNESWQRISEYFDTLFTTEDSIDQLKQTILQLAVMGKLVKQDSNDEPASALLARIAKEKEQLIKDKKIKKQKAPAPITEADKPFDLPDSWEWTPFGTLIQSFTNGLYKPSKFYTDDGCISLRMYNIQQGKIVFDDARRVEVTSEELETYKLEANDLLINRVNSKELVGKTAIIPEHSEDLLYESMNMRAKPFKSHLSSEYLNIFMMSAIATKEIASFAKEAIGQASINQGQVSSIPTPLPPFNEQKKICEMVDSLFAICDRLNNEILSSKEIKSNLADSLKLEELA